MIQGKPFTHPEANEIFHAVMGGKLGDEETRKDLSASFPEDAVELDPEQAEEDELSKRWEQVRQLSVGAESGPIELELEGDGLYMGDYWVPAQFD